MVTHYKSSCSVGGKCVDLLPCDSNYIPVHYTCGLNCFSGFLIIHWKLGGMYDDLKHNL
jgi:hypothetical protein